ncbi:MAG: hypothetical protein Ta2F_18710 [Termitinemataceae bacterium]|nr:MAG: hypothetical protein Ta2F_18710 [Termitinemataceae bacterium]
MGGKRGRGTENKVLVAIAVEVDGKKVGRIRMRVVLYASKQSLHSFIEESIEVGSELWSDGWRGYTRCSLGHFFIKTLNHGNTSRINIRTTHGLLFRRIYF